MEVSFLVFVFVCKNQGSGLGGGTSVGRVSERDQGAKKVKERRSRRRRTESDELTIKESLHMNNLLFLHRRRLLSQHKVRICLLREEVHGRPQLDVRIEPVIVIPILLASPHHHLR